MSEENGAGGPVKRFIAGLPVFFREKILTWELVKRFAVCKTLPELLCLNREFLILKVLGPSFE